MGGVKSLLPSPYVTQNGEMSKYWELAQTLPAQMKPQDREKHCKMIAGELAVLQMAYPTQSRNFTHSEVELTNRLWEEVFCQVHPKLVHEGVMLFIVSDKKGFFPTPGQVVACVEEIIREQQEKETLRRHRQWAEQTLEEWHREENVSSPPSNNTEI